MTNENTNSYLDLLPPNANYTDSQLQSVPKKRKDMYRRYRDMSIFAFIGVYLVSIIDAYVDAELSLRHHTGFKHEGRTNYN